MIANLNVPLKKRIMKVGQTFTTRIN